jgi:hypothetical protein
MNTPTEIQTAHLDRFFARQVAVGLGTHKGYASARTMERACAALDAAKAEFGDRLLVATINAGKSAGRVAPVIYFGETEIVPTSATAFCFHGIIVFREPSRG